MEASDLPHWLLALANIHWNNTTLYPGDRAFAPICPQAVSLRCSFLTGSQNRPDKRSYLSDFVCFWFICARPHICSTFDHDIVGFKAEREEDPTLKHLTSACVLFEHLILVFKQQWAASVLQQPPTKGCFVLTAGGQPVSVLAGLSPPLFPLVFYSLNNALAAMSSWH